MLIWAIGEEDDSLQRGMLKIDEPIWDAGEYYRP